MVDEMPRDSLMAQMMSCPATLVAVVVGRPVGGCLLLTLDVSGIKESSVAREVMDMLVVRVEDKWEWTSKRWSRVL
jgi:ABC-type methionine transport system permease subunit